MKNPASIKGQTIVLTANSTGDYAVQSCLAKWGLKKADVTIKSMGQAEIISAMSSGNADLGGLWAPNIYTMEEKAGAKLICSGQDAGAAVPGALIVRAEYAKEHPQDVAKFLAVYLRAWKWMNAHQPEAIAMMKKFYEQGGVTISEASMKKEFDDAPDVRPRRAAEDHAAAAGRRVRSRRLVHEDRRVHEGERHVSGSARGEQVRHRRIPAAWSTPIRS